MASNRGLSLLPGPCVYCQSSHDLIVGIRRDGEHVALCRDGVRCLRRKMAADGITLLPHPKNPPEEDLGGGPINDAFGGTT